MEQKKLWIDTDAGVDDAQAILMALASPGVEIVGVSTVRGNTDCHQVALNVLRLLRIAGHTEIPVYAGCREALLGNKEDASYYHGFDGFGDVPDPDSPGPELVQPDHGVTALLQAASLNPGEITLVCLGPLTNIAMAIRLDPEIGKKLKACYIMGGNYEGKGNVTMAAEFNFYSDPEAAHVVLSDLRTPITMACWELCVKHALPWKWYREVYSATPTVKGRFIKAIEQKTMANYYAQIICDGVQYETADQMIMAILVKPEIVLKSSGIYCTVELGGGETRGQMICDWTRHTKRPENVTVVTQIHQETYKEMLLNALR